MIYRITRLNGQKYEVGHIRAYQQVLTLPCLSIIAGIDMQTSGRRAEGQAAVEL
jgi:hypothetical protein